jgi:glycosyltransferase involved in cell wall biosynthesis
MKICAVIPAYNEETTIGNIIEETRKYIPTVYVVDNGSTDRTAEIARQKGAEVIYYPLKKGYGAAQFAGQQTALKAEFDFILQLDADGQHNPASIPNLIEMAQSGEYDIVVGSRFLGKDRKQLHNVRKGGIVFFSQLVSFIGHTKITDVTSGFKIYKASTLRRLSKPSDINPAIEQMLEIAKKGMTIKEVEIEMLARTSGDSHLNFLRFAIYPLRAIWLIIKVMLFR